MGHPYRGGDQLSSDGRQHRVVAFRFACEFDQTPAVTNVWIPDGYKDTPVDRFGPRERLTDSLDRIFGEPIDANYLLDAVEAKLFGIGLESYTAGSAEYYMGYSVSRQKLLTLDAGHFHPTEVISEKISSVLMFCPGLLLHVSRPVRWDSDHVVVLDDELRAIAREVVRSGKLADRIHLGLDYFDASINRVAAWVIGMRSLMKALLIALLEPAATLRAAEARLDYTRGSRSLKRRRRSRGLPCGTTTV